MDHDGAPATEPELAALRARAYGPDADIHLDASAVARLHELEGIAETRRDIVAPSAETRVAAPEIASHPTKDAAPSAADEAPPSVVATRRRWWRSAGAWAVIAGAAVIGILVGLIAPVLVQPQAVAQLRPTTSDRPADFPFDWYVIDDETVVRFESYREIDVWTAENEQGVPCLFVSFGLGWLETGCAPGNLDPTVEVNTNDEQPALAELGLPPGSLLRFVLRDDVVGVWVAETREPSPVITP